jgi:hypothetical protein
VSTLTFRAYGYIFNLDYAVVDVGINADAALTNQLDVLIMLTMGSHVTYVGSHTDLSNIVQTVHGYICPAP